MPTLNRLQAPKRASSQPKRSRWGKPTQEGGVDVKFYSTAAWRRVRKLVLLEQPDCQECLKDKRVIPTKVVDHRVPVRFGGGRLDMSNLVGLCHSCHNKKSSRESRIQTRKQWQDFVADNPEYRLDK